jgi:hypothetical protein
VNGLPPGGEEIMGGKDPHAKLCGNPLLMFSAAAMR